ncbi:MAG: hypothetical protein N3A65_00450 [candidate division WOR-3 bacterium]|nr:hypothetical protein [candidate division WOR-3 bacterium]
MNILLTLIITQVNLYFLKNSPDLLVRIKPEIPAQQVIIFYSFAGTKWDSIIARSYNSHFDAVIPMSDTTQVAGFYFLADGNLNNNKGMLYLFEIKKSPRSILPLSFEYLEIMLRQARKKIIARTHIDEGIALVDYVEMILNKIPYVKGLESEIKINLLMSEVNELKRLIAK